MDITKPLGASRSADMRVAADPTAAERAKTDAVTRSVVATEESGEAGRAEAESSSPSEGVRVTFSPRSVEMLIHGACAAADQTATAVRQGGRAIGGVIQSAGELVDALGAGAAAVVSAVSPSVEAGSNVFKDGIDAVRTGAKDLARTLDSAVVESSQRLSERAEAAVGYGALAGLAGGMLFNELA